LRNGRNKHPRGQVPTADDACANPWAGEIGTQFLIPVPATRPGAGDLAKLMEQTRAMTAEWPLLSPAAVQLAQQTFLAPYVPGLNALPAPVVAEAGVETSVLTKQYGIDPGQFGKMIKGLQQDEYRDVRLTTMENGKQVPTSWWNARGVAAIRDLMMASPPKPNGSGDTLRLV
jgi:hypothetical protein